jgi:hypothetical protein
MSHDEWILINQVHYFMENKILFILILILFDLQLLVLVRCG